ncbi:MAG TPA: MFS transporter [Pyrinomonadaceae bacterium]|jgi:MFS family permease|nr:MFS transporter [Pyrinomonadaceae bacterium]
MDARDEEAGADSRAAPERLWRNADFVKLWLGMNVSFLGTQLSSIAYPLTAVLALQASSAEMGWLRATGTAASFLVGPFAGVVADRVRRRPVLIATDLGAALLALSIPAAFFLGALGMGQLYVVQFLAGTLSIFSEVALMAYLPALVRREQLVRANSQVQASSAAVSVAGPGVAGLLVQALSAPVVIIFDAASFVLSAACVALIRAPEPEQGGAEQQRRGVWAEIGDGLRFVYGHGLLRPLAEAVAVHFLFVNVIYTLIVIYAVRELGVGPAALGVVFAALGPGFFVGALLAPRAARRFGPGRVMTYAPLLTLAGMSLVPLAGGSQATAAAVLSAAHFLTACGIQLHGVNMVSLRQAVTPHRLQGRMTASFRYVNLLGACLGALAAGALAERIGLRATIAVGVCGLVLPFLRLFFSPVRRLREVPAAE